MKKKLKKIVIDLSKKSKLFRRFVRYVDLLLKERDYKNYYRKYKVNEKVILFEVFGGRKYSCSPKAIYEQMLKMEQFSDYTFVWAFNDPTKHDVKKSKNLIIVKSLSTDYYKYSSMAKYWIVNSIMPEHMQKKDEQIYVQCWHGTPLKRLRYDIEVNGATLNTTDEIRKRNNKDAVRFDYFISPSAYCTEKFTSAFNLKALGKEDIIIEEGYPRNDSLFNRSEKELEKIKKQLGIPKDKKVVLYIPTFRDNQHTSGVGYTYKFAIDFDRLQKKFSDEYVFLVSLHYFIANSIDLSKYKGFIIDVAKYDELNDLYLVSDVIMTDYSSIFFDFANLKKPMLFYMYDYDDYKDNLRDFYISLDELPGPITQTQEELEKCLENIEHQSKKYKDKYEKFNKKYNYLDDGLASKRVINAIFKEKK